jgi:putative addiction module component (TIGR02574 family)
MGEQESNMETQLERLEAEALKLSANERAAFARMLLESLDEDLDLDEAWAVEADRRIAEIDSGKSKLVPFSEALARVRAQLK